MVQNDTRHAEPIPLGLLALSDATRTYIDCLRGAMPDAARLGERGAFVRDQIDAALRETEPGTPLAVAIALRDLIEP